ncbi:chondroitin sulfate glucuronyltransferase [Trachemys scripta elegans]|uniref:chondroitin sulfate glucuronyltransferase n=1 Tax=Trachemys scripta elegans TaxID=31138 RepID=UPI0015557222|nr:chondroitin sulfate glucuronyltransferase [Trachemys scripta elegans]XP_034615757.1 chondroitin sulfate glucuronyltransferase [Trachemys scripta elegans]XP_034615758.1 chondroitin sulfate glucuronyltransferase [Trachemys scripta elegans]XP_034615759.1 chondroitin sulfate glucuronyltransferase [Trachemys scripta elegans]XP_034615760.1 chondroitin sulfate glucuronyltransferase [Trachemys scripta elegans]XP_034615761.1 chondroitin sulfate glucuronyltransferase [Trachemys scripta elegans]XP_03
MRLATLLAFLRPALPLILGLSLGCSLSLLRVSWIQSDGEDSCMDTGVNNGLFAGKMQQDSVAGGRSSQNDEDFKPRIVPYYRDPNKPYKKVLRTRYIQTELGFHERLFVAVLTSKATMNTLAVAVNKTVAHHFPHLLYFTGLRSAKVPHGMALVSHGDERPVWLMYETMRYIHQHFGGDYDWFYVMQDDTYAQAEQIKTLVTHLSINQDVYLGRAEEFIGGDEQARYCHGGFGYLVSRSLLLKLHRHLDSCRNEILSVRPDEWLGRCIIDFLGISCVSQHQGQHYRSYELAKNADLEKEEGEDFQAALTVHPVSEGTLMYRLHKHFSRIQLDRAYQEIQQLQMQIRNLTSLTPAREDRLTWPIGINAPFVPKSRFEVISWDYFTEQHLFSCPDGSPKCELAGASKADVSDIIEAALQQLNSRYQPQLRFYKQQLLNGYRRFDPTRGMEYVLDLLLEAVTQKGHSHVLAKRVSLVRPLSKVEIIPMPYVTEATRVQLVLPLTVQELDFVSNFLDMFAMNTLDTHDNALLTLLFIYQPYDAQRVSQLDVFAGVKAMVGELEKRYAEVKIPWISVKTEVPSQVKLMDIVSKKHPVDTLFFLASVWTEVNTEFLNRCRMNTISNWQVFFPMHFQEFNPVLMYHGEQAASSSTDFLRDGHFDRHAFAEACFYNSDYMAARTKLAADILDRDEVLESMEVFDVFLRYSGLHLFRAVEPGLVQKYMLRSCNPRLSEELYHRCVLSNLEGLSSRSHLAMALFEQEQANST